MFIAKRSAFLSRIILIAFSVLLVLVNSPFASARILGEKYRDLFSSSNIVFWDPEETPDCGDNVVIFGDSVISTLDKLGIVKQYLPGATVYANGGETWQVAQDKLFDWLNSTDVEIGETNGPRAGASSVKYIPDKYNALVFALGSNNETYYHGESWPTLTEADIDNVMNAVTEKSRNEKQVFFVTNYSLYNQYNFEATNNPTIKAAASKYPNAHVVDWYGAVNHLLDSANPEATRWWPYKANPNNNQDPYLIDDVDTSPSNPEAYALKYNPPTQEVKIKNNTTGAESTISSSEAEQAAAIVNNGGTIDFKLETKNYFVHPTSAGGQLYMQTLVDTLRQYIILENCNNIPDCDQLVNELGEVYSLPQGSSLSGDRIAFIEKWYSTAQKLSIAYGIPWETVVAQGILESGAGTSDIARAKNNLFGIGAYDSCPFECAYSFSSIEESWKGYYENIRKTKTYRNNGVFQGDTITDPHAYLRAIKAAGYATDPEYISKVDPIITTIELLSQQRGWASSAKLASDNPSMLDAAARNSVGGQPTASDFIVTVSASTECLNYSKEGNSSIAETAVNLAWPNSDGTCESNNGPINWASNKSACYSTVKPSYKEAVVSQVGDKGLSYYQDCGHFVSAVIHATGLDPSFPTSGSSIMLNYLASHPEKWAPVENLGNTSNLQPGDIFVLPGHIMIYTGDTSSFGNNASASLGQRTGNMGSIYFQDSRGTYNIYRYNTYQVQQ